jgi:glycosyltransferase involved in cell wall biosynthesis
MRIGIDGRSLITDRAIFRYTKNLLNSLSQIDKDNEYLLFMEGGRPLGEVDYLNLSTNWRLIKAPHKIVLRDHLFFNQLVKKFNIDVFFHPDNTEFLFCHPRSVVTVHDLIPYIYPESSLSPNLLKRCRQTLYISLQKRAISSSASHIITVSNNSKADLMRLFGLSSDSITITQESAEDRYKPVPRAETVKVLENFGIGGDYIFCHAGFSPYKNLLNLVEAFREFSRYNPGVYLVLGGSYRRNDPYFKRIDSVLGKYLLRDKVLLTGYIPEENLPAIYSGAILFVYPSLYEGFGIPLLEAQACGVPVVCSDTSSLPEVVGESAVTFDPSNVSDIADKIVRVYSNEVLREKLTGLGFINVKKYSWLRCAKETLSVFEAVYKSIKL